jgi:hypothetical protein
MSKAMGQGIEANVAQVLVLGAPCLLCLRVALDPNATPAIGYFPLLVAGVFPGLAFGNAMSRKGFGSSPIAIAFLASAFLLTVTGSWIHYWASAYAPVCNETRDGDSGSLFDENREALFDMPARLEAEHFYADCLESLQHNISGWPYEAQKARFKGMTVWHCPGYDAVLLANPKFDRLEQRERTFVCAGLCHSRAPIWTPYWDYAPACGPILSSYMLRTVARAGMQAGIWSGILLCIAIGLALVTLSKNRGVGANATILRV